MTKELERRSNLDRLLIRNARKTPNEIQEITGVAANEALARLNEILDSKDHLTLRRQEILIMEELNELFHESRERMHNAGDRDYAAIANAALRSATHMLARLDAARKANVIDVDKISRGQARVFGKIHDVSLNAILEELAQEFDIPQDRVLELHRIGMVAGQEWAEDNAIEDTE